jgi:hypothetical protein
MNQRTCYLITNSNLQNATYYTCKIRLFKDCNTCVMQLNHKKAAATSSHPNFSII